MACGKHPNSRGCSVNTAQLIGFRNPAGPAAPAACDGGGDAAAAHVQTGPQAHQKAHRGPDHARVPGARQGQQPAVQIPGLGDGWAALLRRGRCAVSRGGAGTAVSCSATWLRRQQRCRRRSCQWRRCAPLRGLLGRHRTATSCSGTLRRRRLGTKRALAMGGSARGDDGGGAARRCVAAVARLPPARQPR